ncbi:MAG: hypothetical protein PHH86_05780, partial [Sphaerochaetaceae bacterium]|nr:hypothetical protein [Sphaerochaetaceae bacterium]
MRRKPVKRFSSSIIAILLVTLLAFALVGCKTGVPEERIEGISTEQAEAEAARIAAEQAAADEAARVAAQQAADAEVARLAAEQAAAEKAAAKAAEEAAAKAAAAEKAAAEAAAKAAAEAAKPVEFDVYLAHTGDIQGQIEEGIGIGFAKLATGVKYGR